MGKKRRAAKFITLDTMPTGTRLDPTDELVMRQAETGEGLIKMTPQGLERLLVDVEVTYREFLAWAKENVTLVRAAQIRRLRVVDGLSWRALARACHEDWGGDWSPPSNQIMGMALCAVAAERFGQDSMKPPWREDTNPLEDLVRGLND